MNLPPKRRQSRNKTTRDSPSSSRTDAAITVEESRRLRHWHWGILLAILVVAGALRIWDLDQIPPGLHVDEAANAWNAYTLLKTGKDQHGVSWPILYTHAFGENRSTIYIYALLPFQAIGGLKPWTTRLPAALSGVLTTLLVFVVGARQFNRETGLLAAGLLALNPWYLQVSRYALEASLTPFCLMASIAGMHWANLPMGERDPKQPRPLIAALAGAIIGISCYGYWSIRIFLPLFIAVMILVNWSAWRSCLGARKEFWAVFIFAITALLIVTPLLWSHLNDPSIAARGRNVGWVWEESDWLGWKVGKVLLRYLQHFSPDFLFVTGDLNPALSPPAGVGLFHWYELPLMAIGIWLTIKRASSSIAARVLLAWILLYPVGDILFGYIGIHSLRSLPGLGAFVLLEAIGMLWLGSWILSKRHHSLQIMCAGSFIVAAVYFNLNALQSFFGAKFDLQKRSESIYPSDILDAARWLRPKLNGLDAVFITGQAIHPYIMTLVGLEYDPYQWFRDTKEIVSGPLPDGRHKFEDIYLRFGKIYFTYNESSLAHLKELSQNGRPDHVVLILRPWELGLERFATPVLEIRGAAGETRLRIFDLIL
jgi:4-amino-4-deoxy-L-arabinose transferase-like glycosyltransferase